MTPRTCHPGELGQTLCGRPSFGRLISRNPERVHCPECRRTLEAQAAEDAAVKAAGRRWLDQVLGRTA